MYRIGNLGKLRMVCHISPVLLQVLEDGYRTPHRWVMGARKRLVSF
jgi:hypothetical protein